MSVCGLLTFLDIIYLFLQFHAEEGERWKNNNRNVREGCLNASSKATSEHTQTHGHGHDQDERCDETYCLPFLYLFFKLSAYYHHYFNSLSWLYIGQELLFISSRGHAWKIRGLQDGHEEGGILIHGRLRPFSASVLQTSCWPKCPSDIMLILNTKTFWEDNSNMPKVQQVDGVIIHVATT